MLVTAEPESDLPISVERILRSNRAPPGCRLLVDHRTLEPDRIVASFDKQVPTLIQMYVSRAANLDVNRGRIRVRMKNDVIFQVTATAVIQEIDSGIDFVTACFLKVSNIQMPRTWIISDQKIALTWECFDSVTMGGTASAHKLHRDAAGSCVECDAGLGQKYTACIA